jgi:hypothetical protein
MKKYYLGLLAFALLTFGLTIFVLLQGVSSKQDRVTEDKIQEISQKLDSYINSKTSIPETLEEAGIKDVPKTIAYRKISEKEYEVCAEFKSASNYNSIGVSNVITGSIFGGYQGDYYDDSYSSSYKPSSLYMYSHKKGKNCQKVEPYMYEDDFFYNKNSLDLNTSLPERNSSTAAIGTLDTERQTDIRALHGQIEAYYAQNGRYPTLNDMNSMTFRDQNLIGLDDEALKDPKGTAAILAAKPAKNIYSYDVTGSGNKACNNTNVDCAKYTLTATLDNGSTYTKSNLN